MWSAAEQPKTRLCRACFDGEYPIGLPSDNLIGKHVLEGVGRRVNAGPIEHEAAEPSNERRLATQHGNAEPLLRP